MSIFIQVLISDINKSRHTVYTAYFSKNWKHLYHRDAKRCSLQSFSVKRSKVYHLSKKKRVDKREQSVRLTGFWWCDQTSWKNKLGGKRRGRLLNNNNNKSASPLYIGNGHIERWQKTRNTHTRKRKEWNKSKSSRKCFLVDCISSCELPSPNGIEILIDRINRFSGGNLGWVSLKDLDDCCHDDIQGASQFV